MGWLDNFKEAFKRGQAEQVLFDSELRKRGKAKLTASLKNSSFEPEAARKREQARTAFVGARQVRAAVLGMTDFEGDKKTEALIDLAS